MVVLISLSTAPSFVRSPYFKNSMPALCHVVKILCSFNRLAVKIRSWKRIMHFLSSAHDTFNASFLVTLCCSTWDRASNNASDDLAIALRQFSAFFLPVVSEPLLPLPLLC